MEFRLLGSLEVFDKGERVPLGGLQQRRILSILLTDPGRTLTYDRLVETLWPDGDAPDNARRTAISYVSRLRTALGDGWIETSDAGYSLNIAAASVDSLRFADLVQSARTVGSDAAVEVLDEALALWRGPVFGDLHDEFWALAMATRLDELRLAALADRIDALSARGWDARSVGEARSLVVLHPLRAAFVERLMRALDATGRTDEALRVFQEHRELFIDRTGLDPSPELIELDRELAGRGHASSSEPIGRPLRGYVLHDVIGTGSFGTVHRATQPQVGRDVAVKVVNADLADDLTFIQRFEAEAQLVARLEHPHIVPLYDFWREPGGAFLVFRLLRGGTAEKSLVVNGPFPLERATRLVEQIGGALSYAHAAGVVHRDVKPANILFDEDGVAYLTDFGIATATPAGESPSDRSAHFPVNASAGSPMYASPEQARDGAADARADQYSLAVTMWELLTGRPPFEGPTAVEVLAAKLSAPLPPLRSHLPATPSRLDDVICRASAVHPDDRFSTIAEFVGAWQAAASGALTTTRGIGDAATDARGAPAADTAISLPGLAINPYKGLRAFGEADAAEFFGRDALISELDRAVSENRVTAVVGPSGSGKSSLVLAGLVPLLKSRGTLIASLTPGDDPFSTISRALTEIGRAEDAVALELSSLHAAGGLARATTALSRVAPVTIIIDQLEELWTTTDPDERAAFVSALADVAQDGGDVRVIVTVRADWFDRPLRDPALGSLVAHSTFGVTPMSSVELHEAISEPAERIGVRFEAGLVGRIVAEVLDQPGSLPLLQFTLAELFDRRAGATIGTLAYEQMGGLAGSVANHADALYESCDDDEQLSIRRMFARLVTPGEGGEDTRRRARLGQLWGIDDRVVGRFVEARLLTVDRDRDTREPTVEIAHEALLRSWPRVRQWLEEDREWVRDLGALSSAARLWDAGGRDEADLYRGARLATIAEQLESRVGALTPAESDFVEASAHRDDAERLAAEERARVRELQNRRLRRSLVGLGVVLVVALAAGAVALVQNRRADDAVALAREQAGLAEQRSADAEVQRGVADEQRVEAESQRAEADQQRAEAEEARAAAEDSAGVATAAERATAIDNLISTSILQRSNRQDLAALLAIEAYRLDPAAARSALFATFTHNVGFEGYRYVDGTSAVHALAPLETTDRALALLDGGRLVELDVVAGRVVREVATLDGAGIDALPFNSLLRLSADGSTVVVAVQGVDAMTWRAYDVRTGNPLGAAIEVPYQSADVPPVPLVFGGFGDAALDFTGAHLVLGGAGGQVIMFDTTTGAAIGSLSVEMPEGWPIPANTASVLFGTDGTLYVGTVTGEVLRVGPMPVDGQLRPVGSIGMERAPLSADIGLRLGSDPDGSEYLITFGTGAISRLDLTTGELRWSRRNGSENLEVANPVDGLQPCRDVVIASGSAHFYCADDFGTLTEQDVATGEPTAHEFDRQTGVTAPLAVSLDGARLLAPSLTSNALASWRLDGGGPIQRVLSDDFSIATYGYDSTDTFLVSQEKFNVPHIWNALTGEAVADSTDFYVGTWAVAPHQMWVAWVATGGMSGGLYDVVTASRVPGPDVEFGGSAAPTPVNDPVHGRMLLRWPDHVTVYDQVGNLIGPTILGSPLQGHNISAVWSTVDGTKLGVSAFTGGTSLYDATTGDPLDIPAVPFVNTVVSPNGIAVGSTIDGRLYTFDPDTLQLLDELPGLHGYAENMSLSDDGTVLITENEGEGERIFDVPTRTQLGDRIQDVDHAVGQVSLRHDGKELAVPAASLGVILWDLDPEHWLDAACVVAGRNLTQEEWAEHLGQFGPYRQTCTAGHVNR